MSGPIRIVQPPLGKFADCCRPHRNVEQRKRRSGHWSWWSHCVPEWRLARLRCHQRISTPALRMFWIFDHMSLWICWLVMFFGTYLDPKQKCVDTFHFWYMQEVLRRSLGYRYVAGNGKMLYPSMTTVSFQAFTSFSHFHFIDAAPRTNCWKGPSFSVEAAGESISFERKSHGWIRMRTFSSMFKGRLSMLDFVLLFLLAIPFLFCTWEDHTMQSAWSSLMCEKCFKFQALQKQHQ